jgi:hypothetical protein
MNKDKKSEKVSFTRNSIIKTHFKQKLEKFKDKPITFTSKANKIQLSLG